MPEDAATLEQPQSTPEPSSNLGESSHEASPEVGHPPAPKNGEQQPKRGLSRYERTKRERAAFKAEREQFLRERDAFTKQQQESAKPKRDYSLKDLTEARAAWATEAEDEWDEAKKQAKLDLVKAADKEIKAIQSEQQAQKAAATRTVQLPVRGTKEHKAMWDEAERDLAQQDPEFMREGTRLDKKLREIMAGPHGELYRDHAQGIYAAYDAAKRALLEEDNKKLQEELKRYRGLTSIGGGAPSRVGTGGRVESVGDFAKLSLKDQRKHLLSGANKNGVPWF